MSGGWNVLAKKFPFSEKNKTLIKKYFMQSMCLGESTTYAACMNVTFYAEGIKFSPAILFRFFHKPIFITWSEIKEHKDSNSIFSKSVFYIDKKKIFLIGRAARYLQNQIEIHNSSI